MKTARFSADVHVNNALFVDSDVNVTTVGAGAAIVCRGGAYIWRGLTVGARVSVLGPSDLQSITSTTVTTRTLEVTSEQASLGLGTGAVILQGGMSARRASVFAEELRSLGPLRVSAAAEAVDGALESAALSVLGGVQVGGASIFNSDLTVKGRLRLTTSNRATRRVARSPCRAG